MSRDAEPQLARIPDPSRMVNSPRSVFGYCVEQRGRPIVFVEHGVALTQEQRDFRLGILVLLPGQVVQKSGEAGWFA